jgi:glucose/arabinose dehydrogenase
MRSARRAFALPTVLATALVLALAVTATAIAAHRPSRAHAASAAPAPVQVIATRLDQPKKVTVAPNGDLIVTESGDGHAPASCTDGNQPSCLDHSGAVAEIDPSTGQVSQLLAGLASLGTDQLDGSATGPVQAELVGGSLQVLFQDESINPRTGAEIYGAAGAMLGDLVSFPAQAGTRAANVEAQFGRFEAANNPDHSAGSPVQYEVEAGIDSDPYAFTPYRGGYAVADAGGNDLLFISRTGKISVLAVFPTIRMRAAAHTYGQLQTRAIEAAAQAVPTSVVVGPDGALYVGELGGAPYTPGTEDVYRVLPGHPMTVYARGLTSIGDMAFDASGHLLVLELDVKGVGEPGFYDGDPASGAIVEIGAHGSETTVASAGLEFPTGIAVTPAGAVYVSDYGISSSAPPGHGGELVRVSLTQY